jgi:CheY-like chemotaxis protein/anti-sigma regulatory factor (Ser/Thr protein kinase)
MDGSADGRDSKYQREFIIDKGDAAGPDHVLPAHMCHELRTPMSCIMAMSERLMGADMPFEHRQCAEIIYSASENLLEIINNILDYSKTEAGGLDLKTDSFDLRATLEDAVEMLAFKAQEKGVGITCLIEPVSPPPLIGDAGKLRQIIVNLAGNAVKYTKRGGIVVRATLAGEDSAAVTVSIEVQDTGIGIPGDKLQRLFTPFTRLDHHSNGGRGGSGLGLAISKKLALLMGGSIEVDSVHGEGSVFTFTCRLTKDPGKKSAAPKYDFSAARALAVSDSPDILRMIVPMLRSLGFGTVAQAGCACSALSELLRAGKAGAPFDIVLLDLDKSSPGGPELAEEIKRRGVTAGAALVRIIPLSLLCGERRADSSVFDEWLTKPPRLSTLAECSAAALKIKTAVRETPSAPPLRGRGSVLLAEDNVISRKVARRIIEGMGYQVDTVSNGAEALEALAKKHYSLALMDCEMPVMDGLEAARQIRSGRAKSLNPGIPVIALTAGPAGGGGKERCIQAGMRDYLSKPVKTAELERVLAQWTGK